MAKVSSCPRHSARDRAKGRLRTALRTDRRKANKRARSCTCDVCIHCSCIHATQTGQNKQNKSHIQFPPPCSWRGIWGQLHKLLVAELAPSPALSGSTTSLLLSRQALLPVTRFAQLRCGVVGLGTQLANSVSQLTPGFAGAEQVRWLRWLAEPRKLSKFYWLVKSPSWRHPLAGHLLALLRWPRASRAIGLTGPWSRTRPACPPLRGCPRSFCASAVSGYIALIDNCSACGLQALAVRRQALAPATPRARG